MTSSIAVIEAVQTAFDVLLDEAKSVDTSELQNAIPDVVVAFSGGVDSSVLLHACAAIVNTSKPQSFKLHALHINHGLSAHSEQWSAQCEQLSQLLGVDFAAVSVDIKQGPRQSLEALARDARYLAIDEWVSVNTPNATVLLGQHQDDQIETFLLALKRGSGVQGLASMPKQFIRQHDVRYMRPLLECSQKQILAYAHAQKLSWVEDESNQDIRFDRNFLRKNILPQLLERWPAFGKTLSRTAALCQQQSELVAQFAGQYLSQIQSATDLSVVADGYANDAVSLALMSKLDTALQQEVIRLWLRKHTKHALSYAQVSEVLRFSHASNDAQPSLRLQEIVIERYQSNLLLHLKASAQIQPACHQQVTRLPVEHLPFCYPHSLFSFVISKQVGVSDDKPDASEPVLECSFGNLNLALKVDAKRPTKTVKKWLKEFGVPPSWRKEVPILTANGKVFAVVLSNQVLLSCELAPPLQNMGYRIENSTAKFEASH